MTRPDPRSPFVALNKLLGLGLLGGAVASYWFDPLWVTLLIGFLALITLGRVPRRLRLLEMCGAFLVLGAYGLGWAMLAPAALCLLACLLAPEAGLSRLNGIDRFMLVQEYEGMAVNSHHALETDRPLDKAAFESAVDSLLKDVPLLRSFVRESFFSAERFHTGEPYVSADDIVLWSQRARADEEHLDKPFDLARTPPWRILIHPLKADEGWRTVITVHHSLTDGTGQVVLFDALMRRYADFLANEQPTPVDHLAKPLPRFRQLLEPMGLSWIWAMIRKHVKPNAKVGVVNASILEDEQAEPGRVVRQFLTLEKDEVERLWNAAKRYRATTNHLFLAASLRAAHSWRKARSKPERPFLVLTPANLRGLLEMEPGLGNYSGIINLDATVADITGESADLIKRIGFQMRKAKDIEEVIEAPMNLGVVSALLPMGTFRQELKKFDADPESFFFSYGYTAVDFPPDLPLPGDVEVRRMWMLGTPARHPGFGLGPVRDRGRVHLMAGYRSGELSDAGALDYLRRLKEELDKLVAAAPERKRRAKGAESSETPAETPAGETPAEETPTEEPQPEEIRGDEPQPQA